MDTARTQTNTAAGSKGGLGGLLAFWYGFFDLVIEWHWRLLLSNPDVLEEFVVGSVGAFLGVAGIAGYNRDRPAVRTPDTPPVVITTADPPASTGVADSGAENGVERVTGNVVRTNDMAVVVTDARPAHVEPDAVTTRAWRFSQRSRDNLAECHPDLARVAARGLSISPVDFVVVCGSRTLDEQRAFVRTGKSRTMNSRHLQTPSMAYDFLPLDNGPVDRHESYAPVVEAMRKAAIAEGVQITLGHDWGWDSGHVELSRESYPDVIDVAVA